MKIRSQYEINSFEKYKIIQHQRYQLWQVREEIQRELTWREIVSRVETESYLFIYFCLINSLEN